MRSDYRTHGPEALHVFALTSLALAQPLFDLLGRNGEFFVASRSGPFEVLVLVGLLVLAVPIALVVVEIVAGGLGARARRAVHLGIVGILLGVIALPLLGRLWNAPGLPVLLAAALVAGAGAAVYARFPPVRLVVSLLSIAIVVVPLNFALNSDARKILFPSSESATAAVGVKADTPVVLLIFDELPLASLLDEHLQIDAGRYPNFARLASTAHWFRNATSVADGTAYAVPAILTGRYPKKGLLPTAADQPDNLFTLLGGAYEITSHEPMTRLCPQSLCREAPGRGSGGLRNFLSDTGIVLGHVLLPPHMARKVLPPIDRGWNAFAGNEPLSESSTRPKGSDAGEGRPELAVRVTSHRRALYAHHFMLPHVPWHFLPTGQQYDRRNPIPGLGLGERWTSDSEEVAQAYQRHLLQVGYVDYVLGDVLAKLEAAGIYDKALLIVVADHGCTFRAGESRRLLTESTWSDILRVPLFVKLPAQNHGVVSDRPAQTIDIVPTIAEVLGVSIPFPVDGQSILTNDARSPEPRVAFNYFFTRFDVPEDLSQLREAVRRKAGLFGVGVDTRKLFGRGPAWRLVGDRVDGLRVSQADNITAVLTEPERFTDVRPDAGFIPALISGRLSGPPITAQHTGIALAINGVIRAIAPVRRSGDGAAFQAVVPGASFRSGLNDVAIFVVDSTTADVRFMRARLTKGGYRLVSDRGTERIDSGFGRSVIVRPDAVRGFVEEASRTNLQDYLSIGGWLVDPNGAGPPAVLVFADNRLVGTAVATIDRPDVAKSLRDVKALRSGYVIRISLSELVGVQNVRLFGISANGAASELHYPPDFPYRSLTLDYRLTSDQKGERVESSAGQPVALQAGAVNGYVDHWSRTQSGDVLIRGWAADRSHPGLTTVLVFANERLVAGVRSTIPRPDVADYFKDRRLLRSGYEASIPRSDLEGAPRIRVFGLSDRGVASELSYTADALQSKR